MAGGGAHGADLPDGNLGSAQPFSHRVSATQEHESIIQWPGMAIRRHSTKSKQNARDPEMPWSQKEMAMPFWEQVSYWRAWPGGLRPRRSSHASGRT